MAHDSETQRMREIRVLTSTNAPARWIRSAPELRSVLRIVTAFPFIQAGTMKLFAFPMGMPPDGSTAPLLSQIGLAGVLETFGGFLLLVGLFTRPVAFVLAGEMAWAYFQVFAPQGGIWLVKYPGAIDTVLYCFLFLYLSAAGAGPWSLDRFRGKA